jgi:hypothetical protein
MLRKSKSRISKYHRNTVNDRIGVGYHTQSTENHGFYRKTTIA